MFDRIRLNLGLVVVALTLLVVAVAFPGKAFAQQSYSGFATFKISLQADKSAQITQTLDYTNTSNTHVTSVIHLTLPFAAVADVKAFAVGSPVPFEMSGTKLSLNLKEQLIGVNQTKKIEISYKIINFVDELDTFRRVYWPVFKLGLPETNYKVEVHYPNNWGEPAYSSRSYSSFAQKDGMNLVVFDRSEEIYLVLGRANYVKATVNWNASNFSAQSSSYRIPLPGRQENPASCKFAEQFPGYLDPEQNNYLQVSVGPRASKSSSYECILTTEAFAARFEQLKRSENYLKDADVLAINNNDNAYQRILERFNPAFPEQAWTKSTAQEIASKSTHTSLDYALALASVYNQQGKSARVVYGIVNFPFTSKPNWHFWVIVKEGDNYLQQDPFLQDHLQFDFYNKINPERLIFGILDPNANLPETGIQHIQNPEQTMRFVSEILPAEIADSKQAPLQMEVSLPHEVIPFEATSIALKLKNPSSYNVYLHDAQVSAGKINDKMGPVLIPAGSETEIILRDVEFEGGLWSTNQEIKVGVDYVSNENSARVEQAVTVEIKTNYLGLLGKASEWTIKFCLLGFLVLVVFKLSRNANLRRFVSKLISLAKRKAI